MIGMATSAGWAQGGEGGDQASKLTIENNTCYANGNPITITASTTTVDKVLISVDNTQETAEIASTGTIYGGSKDKAVESTTIKMESGTIKNIFGGGLFQNATNTNITVTGGKITNVLVGGGHGPKDGYAAATNKTADVTDKTTISVDNAEVYYLVSGSYEYAKTKEVEVTVTGGTKLTYALGGGYAPVSIGQSPDTEYATIANGVEASKFTMTNGDIIGILFVGGGYSYSYSKVVTAKITGVKIGTGLLGVGSNGRSDKVIVEATNCIFEKYGNDPIEVAAINRGKVSDVSMTFKNCTFPSNTADIYANLGATYRWGYNYNGSTSKVEGIPGDVTFVFDSECKNVPVIGVSDGLAAANVTLTGAKALLDKFEWTKDQFHTDFTMDEGKTWTFNDGLEIASGVTLTNNGTLAVEGKFNVTNADQLKTAISAIAEGGTVNLAAGTYTLSEPLVINKAITLQSTDPQNKAVVKGCVSVEAEGATVNNLAFEPTWTSSKYSDKTGIAVFGNSATITGNTFTTSSGGHKRSRWKSKMSNNIIP